MRNRVVRGLLAVALFAGLIAAGCGDDDDDESASSGLTKEEWIAQTDEICAGGGTIEQQVADVRALEVPEGDEDEIAAILAAGDQGLERIEQDPAAMEEAIRLLREYGVTACGGEDDGERAAASPTKQEWLAQANAACERADKVMNREGEALFAEGEPSEKVMKEYALEVVVPAFRRTIEDIRALGAPAGDEQVIEELLAAQEEGTDRVEQDPLSIFEDDEPSEADRLAAEYGLTSCGDTD
jgi:hypothetical protein